jgi:16S rRNA (cytosine1402-N4)-methyltransferase
VISFHSLEDRIVKNFIRERSTADRLPRGVPVRAADLPQPELKPVGRAIKPDAAEAKRNPRSRSAVLRVAEKVH